MRVGQETQVEHEVGVRGDPVLETEREKPDDHRGMFGITPDVVDEMPTQIVDIELGGVDDDVSARS